MWLLVFLIARAAATTSPTLMPTLLPTVFPTTKPTAGPTAPPSFIPTNIPTSVPTSNPTINAYACIYLSDFEPTKDCIREIEASTQTAAEQCDASTTVLLVNSTLNVSLSCELTCCLTPAEIAPIVKTPFADVHPFWACCDVTIYDGSYHNVDMGEAAWVYDRGVYSHKVPDIVNTSNYLDGYIRFVTRLDPVRGHVSFDLYLQMVDIHNVVVYSAMLAEDRGYVKYDQCIENWLINVTVNGPRYKWLNRTAETNTYIGTHYISGMYDTSPIFNYACATMNNEMECDAHVGGWCTPQWAETCVINQFANCAYNSTAYEVIKPIDEIYTFYNNSGRWVAAAIVSRNYTDCAVAALRLLEQSNVDCFLVLSRRYTQKELLPMEESAMHQRISYSDLVAQTMADVYGEESDVVVWLREETTALRLRAIASLMPLQIIRHVNNTNATTIYTLEDRRQLARSTLYTNLGRVPEYTGILPLELIYSTNDMFYPSPDTIEMRMDAWEGRVHRTTTQNVDLACNDEVNGNSEGNWSYCRVWMEECVDFESNTCVNTTACARIPPVCNGIDRVCTNETIPGLLNAMRAMCSQGLLDYRNANWNTDLWIPTGRRIFTPSRTAYTRLATCEYNITAVMCTAIPGMIPMYTASCDIITHRDDDDIELLDAIVYSDRCNQIPGCEYVPSNVATTQKYTNPMWGGVSDKGINTSNPIPLYNKTAERYSADMALTTNTNQDVRMTGRCMRITPRGLTATEDEYAIGFASAAGGVGGLAATGVGYTMVRRRYMT
jgi:hypothetical protein